MKKLAIFFKANTIRIVKGNAVPKSGKKEEITSTVKPCYRALQGAGEKYVLY